MARAAIAYGAQVHGMRRIIATTAPENEASHRVLLKAGMHVGELTRDNDGEITQFFVWDLDRE